MHTLVDMKPPSDACLRCGPQVMARGISAGRIQGRGHVGVPLHLAWQTVADLLLDTTVCNSVASASDALWRGTPMITTLGDALTTRAAASVVMAAGGWPQGVPTTLKEYEENVAAFSLD